MSPHASIKASVLDTLNERLPEIQERFGVETLALFGSVSRGEDTEKSDIDIIYRFNPGTRLYHRMLEMAEYLEALFRRKVDLVSADWIDPLVRPYIEEDAIVLVGDIKERAGVREGLYPPMKGEV